MEPQRIKRSTFTMLESGDVNVFFSAASAREIAIKSALKKLEIPGDVSQYVLDRVSAANFRALPISIEHALAVRNLPLHHADPFDRILIAQAQVEGLTFVTADKKLGKYDIRKLSAR